MKQLILMLSMLAFIAVGCSDGSKTSEAHSHGDETHSHEGGNDGHGHDADAHTHDDGSTHSHSDEDGHGHAHTQEEFSVEGDTAMPIGVHTHDSTGHHHDGHEH